MEEGFKYAPIDMQILSSMLETSLYVKTKGGKKRALRFQPFHRLPQHGDPRTHRRSPAWQMTKDD